MKRTDIVRAMDTMVMCINDESLIDTWLSCGVADGDITEETTDKEIIEAGYTSDTTFKELMDLFIKLMHKAGNNGGLYADGIVSKSLSHKWE